MEALPKRLRRKEVFQMQKKTMLTALIALGFITPIISNTGASAATLNQSNPNASALIQKKFQGQPDSPKLSEKQLKVQDSDIETWMPNPTVRESVLDFLIALNYLPKGSTVNDITKDLLGSIKSRDRVPIEVNTFAGGQITPNLSEGLQYINPQTRVTIEIMDADDSQLMNLDFAQLHQNVDHWLIYIVNPEKSANSKLMQKAIDTNLPNKENTQGDPGIYYVRGNLINNGSKLVAAPSKSIDISKTLFPDISLTDDDFWKEIDRSKFQIHTMISTLITKNNFRVLNHDKYYSFKEGPEGNYAGTLAQTTDSISAMHDVADNPENYYAWLANAFVYKDGQHQRMAVGSIIYADYHK
ncbi:hypothetical protein [Pediococcus acidilactici]|uniref:hypothetical protein n=2 Tax=Pediococcus acidilactici TaxID=1254 RepID=UPI0005675520|nr:hypothetical protein [Pediococcus acidilactici]MDB8864374.1 hypothetical protein [Pediococcus acidilactici]MDB8872007.1 hypothetical protein [Pediococcus acidilactici]